MIIIDTFKDKNNKNVKKGDRCVWRDRLGNERPGIFMGIQGNSGKQAIFLPDDKEKPIHVAVSQLSRK